MLADCGADVIKIETPKGAHFNAGKRSIAVNLANADGRDLVMRLTEQADVFVENYRPGVMRKYGLDYEHLKADRPGLIYCSISGFGQTGPYAQHGAYAPIAHASSGYDVAHMRAQADPDAPPAACPGHDRRHAHRCLRVRRDTNGAIGSCPIGRR
jgi:crotonobetainyl-CoA:carnitine CoA-transferase CaiB-like acyl-CoA transferase